MRRENKVFEQKEETGLNSRQSNPITGRKTANRLYAGYNKPQRFYNHINSVDPMEIFLEFSANVRNKKTVEEVLNYLHFLLINKLGCNFTALGLVNNQSKYINVRLTDHIGNVFSSKILISESNNPIVDCFVNREQKYIDDLKFINIPHIQNSPGIIIPLINQDDCVGVFIAGFAGINSQNEEVLNLLANYLSLLIINRQLSQKVTQDIDIDSLTGLKNHRYFQEKVASEISEAKEKDQTVSVILFDVNNISQINREYGHAKGDEIIKLVADKVNKNIRNCDIAARYGGDEISVMLPSTDNTEARYLAEYLNYIISNCLVDDIGTVKVSVGVATYPTSAINQEKLLVIAEQALLISKSKGCSNGKSSVISADDIDFWNEMALNSLAAVIAKRHSQWGINFEDELVNQFHSESLSSNNHIDIVTSLAGAIDAKDEYTKGHSNSVSRYAEALAKAINLPENEVERIKLGALLHDVGKIGIPENVLKKTAPLSDQEWDIMKQHPEIGVKKVLEPIQSLSDLIPIVKHHHENWNGSGYPNKLKGEDIPLGARIVAIADAFHAMVSDRPYRKALSIDKAVEIMRAGAGIQWDRELIRKFVIIAPSLCTKV